MGASANAQRPQAMIPQGPAFQPVPMNTQQPMGLSGALPPVFNDPMMPVTGYQPIQPPVAPQAPMPSFGALPQLNLPQFNVPQAPMVNSPMMNQLPEARQAMMDALRNRQAAGGLPAGLLGAFRNFR